MGALHLGRALRAFGVHRQLQAGALRTPLSVLLSLSSGPALFLLSSVQESLCPDSRGLWQVGFEGSLWLARAGPRS